MPNEIPSSKRRQVADRDRGQCQRCGGRGATHWHHRQPRRGSDPHRHCACIGVTLCTTCHADVHANPARSREEGFIVSRFLSEPSIMPIRTFHGEVLNTCDGGQEPFQPGKIHERES